MTYFVVNKWGRAKKQVYNGIRYDSGFEAQQAQELELRKKVGDIKDFIAHKRIPLIVNDYHICDYIIDFEVEHNDGTTEYIEVKGLKSPEWVIKFKILEAMFGDDPNVKLTLVSQRPIKLRKIRKTSCLGR